MTEDEDFSLGLLEALPELRRQAKSYARGGSVDDLVQQVCLLAWRHRAKLEGNVTRWCRLILRNLARTQWARRPPEHISIDATTDALDGVIKMSAEDMRNSGNVLRATATKPTQEHYISLLELIDSMNSLPPRYLVPLTMFAIDGLSYEELGESLDIKAEHARSMVCLARSRLREVSLMNTNSEREYPGARLRRLRLEKGITLRQIAEGIGCGIPNVSYLENLRHKLPASRLPDLARILDVSVDYLMTGSEGSPTQAQMVVAA